MTNIAILAGGCFWGLQSYFDQVPGVTNTIVGYTGGHIDKPTYEQVCHGSTGHAEAIKITYDPKKVTYQQLLKHFFYMHDPTQLNRQGPDEGEQYRSAIFYLDEEQRQAALKAINEAQKNFKDSIVTEVTKADTFWSAEDYHQKYTERTGRGLCHVPYKGSIE